MMTTTQPRTNTLRRRPWPHELADACGADGLSLAQVQQRWGLSTWPAYQSVVDAIEIGAIVRVGTARTKACRYLRADLPAEVIEQREAEIRARIRVRRKERVPMEDGIPIRRIIVSAAEAKPLTVRGPRSVWELGR